MERVLIFANPIAGRGLGEAIAYRVRDGLAAGGYDARMWLLPPADLSAADLPDGVMAAVAIGGDGTVRSVAERLYTLAVAAGREAPPLLIIPLGTANLMVRHLGIDWDDDHLEAQVTSAIRDGEVTWIDAASCNGSLFLLMVGVGFDAAVVHELSRVRRGPISYASYVLPAATVAASYRFPAVRVEVDGKLVFGPEDGVVFVGNVQEYGTGFPFLPLARPDDGLLDICAMPCSNIVEAARLVLLAAAGEHIHEEGVVYVKGKHVKIDSLNRRAGVPVQIDGDAAGHTPVDISLMPVRMRLIVPR
jgi:diacylglycerol kinase (ATP)